MAKRSDQIVAGLTGAIKGAIKEEITQMQATGQIPTSEDSEFEDQDLHPSSPEVKRMLSAFPSSEGYYGKIYRVKSNGKYELMDYYIQAPEAIEDIELEVSRIIKEKGWSHGDYRIQVRNTRKRGIFLNELVSIGGVKAKDRDDNGGAEDPVENLSRTIDIVDKIRGSASSPEVFGQVILKAVEVGRASAAPAPSNGQDALLKTLIEVVLPIVKEFIPKSAPASDVDTIVEKVVARIQPKEDFFQSLLKYSEVMSKLNPQPKKEDALDSVNKVTQIVQAIRPLTVGAAGEPPSWGQLLLEHGSKLLEPIISTFKEFAEAKKMEMQLRMNQYQVGGPQPEGQLSPKNLPIKSIHPFAARILKAVTNNDESYFDMMRQQLVRLYGQHVIDELISGNLTPDLVISTIQDELGFPSDNQSLKPYIENFVKFLRQNVASTGVLAECKTCKEQYDFPNMEAWRKDGKKCDCGGDLELVKQEGEA